ncbi:MAG: hypothetical protein CME70_18320 [Halobacteriovorax sp.]|nr:hypothetical protein [Halobacteriovorax sp.]|tara:strand:+ start:9820 stop:10461 length:642 start_codon:yes stop_codon:yes gene_type:complete
MPWILPIIHPASIVRGRWHEDSAQIVYLKQIKKILNNPTNPSNYPTDPNNLPENTKLWPTLNDLEKFTNQLENFDLLSIDIENAGPYLTLIGITALSAERNELGPTLSLPYRMRYGHNYWADWESHLKATEYLYRWLINPKLGKIFHNGVTHDVPILEEHGFIVGGEIWDTMVMQHYMYPEMRKGLQYCATLYTGAAHWKDLLDDKDETEGKG